MKFKLDPTLIYGIVISAIRNFVGDTVVTTIKKAIDDFTGAASDGWQEGEREAFVLTQVQAITAETPNTYDDVLVPILVRLYIAYRVAQGKAPKASVVETAD